jgi:hypothetical protein
MRPAIGRIIKVGYCRTGVEHADGGGKLVGEMAARGGRERERERERGRDCNQKNKKEEEEEEEEEGDSDIHRNN